MFAYYYKLPGRTAGNAWSEHLLIGMGHGLSDASCQANGLIG
jgi:hypothetical protein